MYNTDDPSTYRVEFSKGDHQIIVDYDHSGDIIASTEIYNNIRLPYDVSSEISKSVRQAHF